MNGEKTIRILGIVLAVSMALNLYLCHRPVETTTYSDTTVYVDTIVHHKVVPKDSTVVRYVTEVFPVYESVTDTIYDSIQVRIPITQKVYREEEFEAFISGYKPSLDSINIFAKERHIIERVEVERQKRFGVGIHAGYGISPKGAQPYIGVGISYNFFTF